MLSWFLERRTKSATGARRAKAAAVPLLFYLQETNDVAREADEYNNIAM